MFSHRKLSDVKRQHITASPLTGHDDWLELVLEWSQEESAGLLAAGEAELQCISDNQQNFYVVEFGIGPLRQAVGMFALFDNEIDAEILDQSGEHRMGNIKDLDYFYIIPALRGQGVGNIVIQHAKAIAKNLGADLIVFDTLNSHLNAFYERCGAKIVCDSRFVAFDHDKTHASTLLRMDV